MPARDIRKGEKLNCPRAARFSSPSVVGFAFVRYSDSSVFDLDLNEAIDPSNNGAGCYIITGDADQWHARLVAAGLPVTPIADMPWGMREFALTDPSGNRLRIGNNI